MSMLNALMTRLHWLSDRTKKHLIDKYMRRYETVPEPNFPQTPTQFPPQQRVTVPIVKPKTMLELITDRPPAPAPASRAKEARQLYGRLMREDLDLPARQDAGTQLSNLKKEAKVSWLTLGLPMHTQNHINQVLAKATTTPKAPTRQSGTRSQRARALFVAGDIPALIAFRKKVKLGWQALGFTSEEIEQILKK